VSGVPASPIRVSGTQIVAITNASGVSKCTGQSGPITVTNIDNGSSASGPTFTYVVAKPRFLSAPATIKEGSTIDVTLADANERGRFTIGPRTVAIIATRTESNGARTFTLRVPALAPRNCGDTKPLSVALTFLDATTECGESVPVVVERTSLDPCDPRPQS
jgi:hypothetical protein